MEILSSFVQQVVAHIYELTRLMGETSYGLDIIIMTMLITLILWPGSLLHPAHPVRSDHLYPVQTDHAPL